MLSYRHSFHAGNHADLLKHLVLLALVRKLGEKDKPFTCLDSHAGAGTYDLQSANALMNAEYESGIARLWRQPVKSPLLQDYLDCVEALNPDGELHYYPGSPAVARWALRERDRLLLLDLQQEEVELLRAHMRGDARIAIHQRDAFEGVLALTPPDPRRGLVLIDPSYEQKADYQRVVDCVHKLHRRWPVGILAVWYPLLGEARDRSEWLKRALQQERLDAVSCIELAVSPQTPEFGMHGSGMLLVNTPWQLERVLEDALNEVLPRLGVDAHFSIETLSESE